MYCKICGAALNPDDVFCRNCGASNVNNNQPNNQYQSMEFVEPVSPMNNYQQPTPPAGPAYQQPTPSVQPMPNVQPNIPTPPVNNNYPQPMNKNNNSNKSNGTIMIIGIIVGILAIAIVGYLVYTTLTDKNVDNGTTIVSKKNYNVYFAKHKFTFENDDVATPSETSLKVSTSKYYAIIQAVDVLDFTTLNATTVNKFITKAASAQGFTTAETKSSTYSGLTYFKTNISSSLMKATFLVAPKSNGGFWLILVQNNAGATTYPTDSAMNGVLELVKSATFSTSASIETDIDFDFSTIDFDSIIKSDSQESAE